MANSLIGAGGISSPITSTISKVSGVDTSKTKTSTPPKPTNSSTPTIGVGGISSPITSTISKVSGVDTSKTTTPTPTSSSTSFTPTPKKDVQTLTKEDVAGVASGRSIDLNRFPKGTYNVDQLQAGTDIAQTGNYTVNFATGDIQRFTPGEGSVYYNGVKGSWSTLRQTKAQKELVLSQKPSYLAYATPSSTEYELIAQKALVARGLQTPSEQKRIATPTEAAQAMSKTSDQISSKLGGSLAYSQYGAVMSSPERLVKYPTASSTPQPSTFREKVQRLEGVTQKVISTSGVGFFVPSGREEVKQMAKGFFDVDVLSPKETLKATKENVLSGNVAALRGEVAAVALDVWGAGELISIGRSAFKKVAGKEIVKKIEEKGASQVLKETTTKISENLGSKEAIKETTKKVVSGAGESAVDIGKQAKAYFYETPAKQIGKDFTKAVVIPSAVMLGAKEGVKLGRSEEQKQLLTGTVSQAYTQGFNTELNKQAWYKGVVADVNPELSDKKAKEAAKTAAVEQIMFENPNISREKATSAVERLARERKRTNLFEIPVFLGAGAVGEGIIRQSLGRVSTKLAGKTVAGESVKQVYKQIVTQPSRYAGGLESLGAYTVSQISRDVAPSRTIRDVETGKIVGVSKGGMYSAFNLKIGAAEINPFEAAASTLIGGEVSKFANRMITPRQEFAKVLEVKPELGQSTVSKVASKIASPASRERSTAKAIEYGYYTIDWFEKPADTLRDVWEAGGRRFGKTYKQSASIATKEGDLILGSVERGSAGRIKSYGFSFSGTTSKGLSQAQNKNVADSLSKARSQSKSVSRSLNDAFSGTTSKASSTTESKGMGESQTKAMSDSISESLSASMGETFAMTPLLRSPPPIIPKLPGFPGGGKGGQAVTGKKYLNELEAGKQFFSSQLLGTPIDMGAIRTNTFYKQARLSKKAIKKLGLKTTIKRKVKRR